MPKFSISSEEYMFAWPYDRKRKVKVTLRSPRLVQRCVLGNVRLCYQYMGMSEFEMGDQARSLKRIFAQGLATDSAKVDVEGHEIIIYMVAAAAFPFAMYAVHLQVLANEKYHRPEPTHLKQVIRKRYEIPGNDEWDDDYKVNVWFDFQNGVLFVLSETDLDQLTSALKAIQQKWSQKNA